MNRRQFVVISCLIACVGSCGAPTKCSFLYQNTDWADHESIADTAFEQSVSPPGSVKGVVTASFEIFEGGCIYKGDKTWVSYDFLRFIKTAGDTEEDQPLVFKIHRSGKKVEIINPA